jgi:hypothetical protein
MGMRLLRTIGAAWRRLALRIAIINGVIIMALFYLLVITPYAIVLRLLRQDLLDRRWERERESYWRPREARVRGVDTYLRPF